MKKFLLYQALIGFFAVSFLSYLISLDTFLPVIEGQIQWEYVFTALFLAALAISAAITIVIYAVEVKFFLAPNDPRDLITPLKIGYISGFTIAVAILLSAMGILSLWLGVGIALLLGAISIFI